MFAHPPEEPEELPVVDSLPALLRLDGATFVRHAYAAMLGRPVDPDGEAYYLARLERGYGKLQVLEQLRKSPEARLFPYVPDGTNEVLARLRGLTKWVGRRRAAERVERFALTRFARPDSSRFLRYRDAEFVRVVFRYFLDRDPDPVGGEHYLERLRSGVSRQQVLIEISRSPEAHAKGRTIRDAQRLARRVALARLPLIGNAIAFAQLLSRANDHLQDLRVLENQVYRLSKTTELR